MGAVVDKGCWVFKGIIRARRRAKGMEERGDKRKYTEGRAEGREGEMGRGEGEMERGEVRG
jgi:hypothetical protein